MKVNLGKENIIEDIEWKASGSLVVERNTTKKTCS